MGRQLFSASDIGEKKSTVTVTRINRFFGTKWKSLGNFSTAQTGNFNIVITCTDTVKSREAVDRWIKTKNMECDRDDRLVYYWLDFGNGKNFGQAIMGMYNKNSPSRLLPNVFDVYPDLKETEEKNEPSCSLAQALQSQDLYVNSTIANLGMNLLWKVFSEKKTKQYGVVMDLKTLQVRSFKAKEKKENGKNES
jgi:PRTRC genetic system ThiF family protein